MVIILEQFTQQEEIEGRGIPGFIFVIKIGIAILMAAPVDDGAVYRPHHKVDGQ